MTRNGSYSDIMNQQNEILRRTIGIGYEKLEQDTLALDYEGLFAAAGYALEEIREIQHQLRVGSTICLNSRISPALCEKWLQKGKERGFL